MRIGRAMVVALLSEGSVEVTASTDRVRAQAGDIVVVAPGVEASATAVTDVEGFMVVMREEFLAGLLLWVGTDGREKVSWAGPGRDAVRRIGPDGSDAFVKLRRSLRRTVKAAGEPTMMPVLAAALSLLRRVDNVSPLPSRPPLPLHLRDQVDAACRLMWEDHARKWTAESLARAVGMSESALTRAFRRALGMTPAVFLREVRLRRFAEYLVVTPLSVTEASRRAGWATTSTARLLMIQRYGVPPSEFRAQYWREEPAEDSLSA